MLVLWEKDPISVNEIGEELNLDSGTLSPLLKKIEALGFISRQRDPADERRVIITLTKKGRDLRNKAEDIPFNLMCGMGLDAKSLDRLKEEMNQLNKKVKKTLEE